MIPRTAQEIEKINVLRHEYVNEWSKLTEGFRKWYNDQDADFETQTIRSTGAEEIALLDNRIGSIQGSLRLEDNENRVKRSDGIPIPTPMPTPPPLSPVGVSILVQDYNKMWEFTYAEYQFQSSVNRGAQRDGEIANGLVDQELAFRASLKGLDQSNQIQKLTWRMKYFGNLHSQIFHNGRKLEEWEPHRPSGLERLDLSAKPTLAPTPTPTPTPSPTPTPTPVPTPTPTPVPTPTPTPTPYPEAADLWREREHVVKQEYDKAWTALPDATRLQLHDGEVTFRVTIKTFDPPTRMRTLKKRIEYLKSLTPRSAAVPTPAPNPTPTPSSDTPDLPKNSAEQALRDFIITGQSDDVSRRAAHLMDDLTKFYDRGAISRQEACALMAAYNRKWPIRRFRPDDLSVQVERINRGVFKLSQSFDWEVSDGRRRKTGRSRIVCEILQTDGDYKIVSVDEVKE